MSEGRAQKMGRPTEVTPDLVEGWRQLREIAQLSYTQIEEKTGWPADTVRYHLTRKKKRAPRITTPEAQLIDPSGEGALVIDSKDTRSPLTPTTYRK